MSLLYINVIYSRLNKIGLINKMGDYGSSIIYLDESLESKSRSYGDANHEGSGTLMNKGNSLQDMEWKDGKMDMERYGSMKPFRLTFQLNKEHNKVKRDDTENGTKPKSINPTKIVLAELVEGLTPMTHATITSHVLNWKSEFCNMHDQGILRIFQN